jgi:hypothetical protein
MGDTAIDREIGGLFTYWKGVYRVFRNIMWNYLRKFAHNKLVLFNLLFII